MHYEYRIHGDNIVECERTLELIARAFEIPTHSHFEPTGSPLTPTYQLAVKGRQATFAFTFFPGYGRWDTDIIEVVRRRGGRLREAADAIICSVNGGHETPVLAIEYCGALPAGNQAWQRNGRAFSFAHAGIPYFYIAELSGYELNAERQRKAARLPNPAVPFSYLLLTEATESPALPIFVRSPGASDDAVLAHSPFYGEQELLEIMACILLGEQPDKPRNALEAKVLELVNFLAGSRKRSDTLTPKQWTAAFGAVQRGSTLPAYLCNESPIKWSKTAYIEGLTETAARLMTLTAKFASGLTSSSLPMCVIPARVRKDFAHALVGLYPALPKAFVEWCRRDQDLAVCWVMGFKPRGDDARPDRGLPPLCRMLAGDSTDMLTVVYGPAPASTWPQLTNTPSSLMSQNGLWEAALVCSDAILVDANTLATSTPLAFLKSHWESSTRLEPPGPFAVTPTPVRAGENDVDTVLHLLFARLGHPHVFEGMCNPPGGDWSGLSMLTADRALEMRWLGLPRVTAEGAKRPDHVFQIFDMFDPYLILAIESKERAKSVEVSIGPRLVKYVGDLVQAMPSVQRPPAGTWSHFAESSERTMPKMASAAAFVANSKSELSAVAVTANVDLVLGCHFPSRPDSCELWIHCCTPLGAEVAKFVKAIQPKALKLAITIL